MCWRVDKLESHGRAVRPALPDAVLSIGGIRGALALSRLYRVASICVARVHHQTRWSRNMESRRNRGVGYRGADETRQADSISLSRVRRNRVGGSGCREEKQTMANSNYHPTRWAMATPNVHQHPSGPLWSAWRPPARRQEDQRHGPHDNGNKAGIGHRSGRCMRPVAEPGGRKGEKAGRSHARSNDGTGRQQCGESGRGSTTPS